MKYTKNYGLIKPENTDFYDVNNQNDNMDIIDEKLKEIEESGGSGGNNNIVYLTQAEYDALPDSKYSNNVEYRITDEGIEGTASNLSYDNTESGLQALNVQTAIDEVVGNVKLHLLDITLPEVSALEMGKYIRENVEPSFMFENGYHFKALVNKEEFFTGHIYTDYYDVGGAYWGTIESRLGGVCKYQYIGGADSVIPFNKKVIVKAIGGTSVSNHGYGAFEMSAEDNPYSNLKIISEASSRGAYMTSKDLTIGGVSQSWSVGHSYDIKGKAVWIYFYLESTSNNYATITLNIELS